MMPESQTVRLREKDIERAPFCPVDPGGKARPYVWRDIVVTGLMVVFNAQSKTYKVQRDLYAQGKDGGPRQIVGTRKITLGTVDDMGLEEAREKAAELIKQMRRGIDPRAPARQRKELTLQDAWDAFREERVRLGRSAGTLEFYRDYVERNLKHLLDKPLREIGEDREGIDALHVKLTRDRGPSSANGTMRTLRAIYGARLKKDPSLPPNPVGAVTFNRERPRDVVVTDLASWWAQTEAMKNPVRRDLHRFMLLTGMRKTAASHARREHFDPEAGFLRVPSPKGGTDRAFDLPLSARLIEMLQARITDNTAFLEAKLGRKPTEAEAGWIFPTILDDGTVGPVSEPKEKGMVNPHALRHTYATAAKAAGLSEFDIKLLLNHKLPGVTGGYIHGTSLGDHLRQCQQTVTAFVLGRANRQ
jgi:integrase